MNSDKKVLNTISKKIGIKLLDKKQIEILFPEYERMLDMIEKQRNRASNGGIYVKNERYHLMHDNILGIFGGRGSGKTSVIFSLCEKLSKEKPNDIVLPVVSPELIGNNCSILSLVLSMLEKHVKSLDLYLQNNESCMNEFLKQFNLFENKCNIYKNKSLFLEEYETLLRNCNTTYSLEKYPYDEAVEIQMYQSEVQYKLMESLNKFWDMLIFIQKQKNPCNEQPLLFIMFDDIDLAPERSMELVLSSYKYFSNANICIILSAALKTLKQILTCRIYERAIGSNFNSLIQNNYLLSNNSMDIYGLEHAGESATEYLNKVIPQSSRFVLTSFDTIDKKQLFRYPLDFNSQYNPDNNLSIPLDELLIEVLNESGLLNEIKLKNINHNHNNFFLINRKFSKKYYLMFGNKSRYINNSCLAIINGICSLSEIKILMNEELSNLEYTHTHTKYIRKIYNILNSLLLTLITSHSRELEEYSCCIQELLKYNKQQNNLFIDYSFLNYQYKLKIDNIKKDLAGTLKNVEEYMTFQEIEDYKNNFLSTEIVNLRRKIGVLFVILNFIEHLIYLVLPSYYSVSGNKRNIRKLNNNKQVMDFINKATMFNNKDYKINLYPNINSEDPLDVYIDILEYPERFINFSIYDVECVADYFSYLNNNFIINKMISTKLNNGYPQILTTYHNNSDWIKTICNMLYLNKSGIQLLQKDFFENTNDFFGDIAIIPQLSSIKQIYTKQIYRFVDSWNLKQKANDLYKKINFEIYINTKLDYKWTEIFDLFNHDKYDINYSDFISYIDYIAYKFIKQNQKHTNILDLNEYYTEIDFLFQDLYLKIIRNIPKWPLEFHIKSSKINSALDAILGLSSTSEQLRLELKEIEERISNFASELFNSKENIEMMEKIENKTNEIMQQISSLNKFYKDKSEKYLSFNFYKIFRIASRVSVILNSFIDDEMNNYFAYNSLLSLFDNMEIVSLENDDKSGYLKELLTFIGLIPHYIAAQFYLKNDKQYFEYSIKTKGEIKNSKTIISKSDYAAEKYSEIIEKISPSDGSEPDDVYNILFKTLVNIKNRYIRDKMREFGVIQE